MNSHNSIKILPCRIVKAQIRGIKYMHSSWDMRSKICYISHVSVLSATVNIRVEETSKLVHQGFPLPLLHALTICIFFVGLSGCFKVIQVGFAPSYPLSLQSCPDDRKAWTHHPWSCSRPIWMGL